MNQQWDSPHNWSWVKYLFNRNNEVKNWQNHHYFVDYSDEWQGWLHSSTYPVERLDLRWKESLWPRIHEIARLGYLRSVRPHCGTVFRRFSLMGLGLCICIKGRFFINNSRHPRYLNSRWCVGLRGSEGGLCIGRCLVYLLWIVIALNVRSCHDLVYAWLLSFN